MQKNSLLKTAITAALLSLTAACASTGNTDVNDPYENTNRAIWKFNRVVDKAVTRPVAVGYRTIVPELPRKGISNIFRNLTEPWSFVNNILQGDINGAATTLGRFTINTTVGLAGIFKVSDKMGIQYQREDFGQTLAVWGVNDGPYLVLPFLGPSNGRDAFGTIGDFTAEPVNIGIDRLDEKGLLLAKLSLEVIDTRARLHSTIESLYEENDPYAFARAAYRQQRDFQIRNGKRDTSEEDDLFDALEDDE
ncbi:VacJ family lipoprotein [Kordiimonas sp. SCSIO 12610]|uniref:MlaA family lipoprotein n=1 Tax=Kordiimonas sp. SCSIO 12610 TaxID=2829597 RepID=UPI00210A972C|nr:VacJ family lipoprotein [Kordiimonas sp. SCSIO 12610]UTW54477.1 VacJ family lipoprotein [Kordiimonas sp. SCSIO 12610]